MLILMPALGFQVIIQERSNFHMPYVPNHAQSAVKFAASVSMGMVFLICLVISQASISTAATMPNGDVSIGTQNHAGEIIRTNTGVIRNLDTYYTMSTLPHATSRSNHSQRPEAPDVNHQE